MLTIWWFFTPSLYVFHLLKANYMLTIPWPCFREYVMLLFAENYLLTILWPFSAQRVCDVAHLL
jgi:hypothetical protein